MWKCFSSGSIAKCKFVDRSIEIQNGAQCFGVLGGAVDVQLMDNVSEIPRFTWEMNNSKILYGRNNNVTSKKDDRILFFPSNGSVRINDLRKTDSDEYKLEMFDGNGKSTGFKTLQLFVIGNQIFVFQFFFNVLLF
uniref:Immunoglobulin V-set domain-containing protein n=1 Tax=Xiphophorus couchianus TaxID=32473 RepID=A0A3B5L8I1_9TELE